jgi:hypothetical protein
LTFTTNFLLPVLRDLQWFAIQGCAAGLCDRAVLQFEALSILQSADSVV